MKTITTGSDQDNDGYVIVFGAASTQKEVPIGASDSLWISEEDLPAGANWVSLEGIAANCWSPGRWRPGLFIRGDATTRVEFSIECMPWVVYNSGIIYDRVGPNSYGRSEHYILLSNNRFRLQFGGGNHDTSEFGGTYARSDSTISFAFDEPSWSATGTLTGDSLLVEYNDSAILADFEGGVFVRSP